MMPPLSNNMLGCVIAGTLSVHGVYISEDSEVQCMSVHNSNISGIKPFLALALDQGQSLHAHGHKCKYQ